MYNFYENPPRTKEEIREYLTSLLQPVIEDDCITIDNETFIQEQGFRRAFQCHCIFRSLLTNKYVWWVFEEQDTKIFPKERFSSYDELLEHVINEYYIRFNE